MLEGVKIFDFTQYLPGPFATLRLSDYGAEVIKVERPGGEPARMLSEGKIFQANNRNKQSLTIDLKNSKEVDKMKTLLLTADVLVESFRPGVMDTLGLGYEDLKKLNPRLVYCSLTGYGQNGSLSSLASHDINYMALSGLLSQLKDENGRPVHPTLTFADLVGGMAASEAILAALVKCGRTGEGTWIDLAITDSMVSLLTTHLLYPENRGVPELAGNIVSYRLYETKDGRFMSMGALERKFWDNFCLAVDRDHWSSWHLEKAVSGNKAFEEISQLFLSETFDFWSALAETIDCCLAPVLEPDEVKDSSYNRSRGRIIHSSWGDLQVLTAGRKREWSPPPELNEHHDHNTPLTK